MAKTANLDFFGQDYFWAGIFLSWDVFETALLTWHY